MMQMHGQSGTRMQRGTRMRTTGGGLFLWALLFCPSVAILASEVATPTYNYDKGGGTILPTPNVTTVEINFDPSASLPLAAQPGRFYRAIWEFNTDRPGHKANPQLNVAGCGATTVTPLGFSPNAVVDPGDNNELETEPSLGDVLSAPPGQPPEVHTGPDLVPNTRVAKNIVIKAGDDLFIQTVPNGDDVQRADLDPTSPTFGQPVVLAGPDNVADTFALPGICIRSGPTGVIAAVPVGDDLLAPGGDPETGHDVIIDGGDMVCSTNADVVNGGDVQFVGVGVRPHDDAQVASVGAFVGITNIVIDPGPNGALESVPNPLSDDKLGTDVRGRPVILAGENRIPESQIGMGDDVQVLERGSGNAVPNKVKPFTAPTVQAITFVVTAGANGAMDTIPAGDDILTIDVLNRPVIVVGDNLIANTAADPLSDDVQVLPPGSAVPGYLVPNDTANYNYGWRFTDDIQVLDPDATGGIQNPGLDTGYTTLDVAKARQCAEYSFPTIQPPNDIDQIVCVRYRLFIAQDANGTGATEAIFEQLIHLSMPNFQPVADVTLSASQADTIDVGDSVSIALADSYDQDGYLLWGAIDWGDGNVTILTEAQLTQLPLLLGDISHPAGGYATSGIYRVTVSIIDNGRLSLLQRSGFRPFQASTTETNPDVVLDEAIRYQMANLPPNVQIDNTPPIPGYGTIDILGNDVDPVLMKNFIAIRVLGGLSARAGILRTDLSLTGRDSLKLAFQSTSPLTIDLDTTATITLTNPISGASKIIGSGRVDSRRGSFVDQGTGLRFRYNSNSRLIVLQINRSDIRDLFSYYLPTGAATSSSASGVQNGYAEAVISVTGITGGDPIGRIRFAYSSSQKSGHGKSPKSVNDPG